MLAGPSNEDVEKIARELHEMVESWVTKLRSKPDIYAKPCEDIVEQSSSMATRDSQLISAMQMFGKYHGPAPIKKWKWPHGGRGGSTIPTQATSRSRRMVYLGGRNTQFTGRPSNAMRQRMRKDHNFSKGASTASQPAWFRRPSSRSKAPHSLNACVARGVPLGKTHHKK